MGYQPEGFRNYHMGERHPGYVEDAQMSHTIHGMLARKRGVGKTHELARMIQRDHMDDGFMICFSHKEAERVHDAYGIDTTAIKNYHAQNWYTQDIPFVDPEVLGTLMLHHDNEMRHQDQHYLRKISVLRTALEKEKDKNYRAHRDLLRFLDDQRHRDAIVWLIFSMGKLPSTKQALVEPVETV